MGLEVYKEPKGFIKFIEIIISICAFSTLVGYSEWMAFYLDCKVEGGQPEFLRDDQQVVTFDNDGFHNATYLMELNYPFKLESLSPSKDNCDQQRTQVSLEDKSSSHAVFFVFVGTVSFLFSLAMLFVYFLEKQITSVIPFFPSVDLILHGFFVVLWFCAAITWSAGLANLKVSTNPDNVIELNEAKFSCSEKDIECTFDPPSNYAGPVVASIFGYVSLMLFVGNLWFVYKDTGFHS